MDPIPKGAIRIPDVLAIEALSMRERINLADDPRSPGERLAENIAGWIVDHVALSNTEMGELARAAQLAGLELTQWVHDTLFSAARLALLDASRLTEGDDIPL